MRKVYKMKQSQFGLIYALLIMGVFAFSSMIFEEKAIAAETESKIDEVDRFIQLGSVEFKRRNYEKAIDYLERALILSEKSLGTDHPKVALIYNYLGTVWFEEGRHHLAMDLFLKSLSRNLKTFGDEHITVANDWFSIGKYWNAQGRHDLAVKYFNKALLYYEKKLGNENLETATIRKFLEKAKQLQNLNNRTGMNSGKHPNNNAAQNSLKTNDLEEALSSFYEPYLEGLEESIQIKKEEKKKKRLAEIARLIKIWESDLSPEEVLEMHRVTGFPVSRILSLPEKTKEKYNSMKKNKGK